MEDVNSEIIEKILRYRTLKGLDLSDVQKLRTNFDFLVGSDLLDSKCYIKQTLNNLFVTLSTKVYDKHFVRYNLSLGQMSVGKLSKHHKSSGDLIFSMGFKVFEFAEKVGIKNIAIYITQMSPVGNWYRLRKFIKGLKGNKSKKEQKIKIRRLSFRLSLAHNGCRSKKQRRKKRKASIIRKK